jgi:Neuraminidase (sialidase)
MFMAVPLASNAQVNFAQPTPLNTNAAMDTGFDHFPVVVTDRAGTWVAAWSSGDSLGNSIGTDEDLLFQRSTDNGATWSPVAPLNTNAASDTYSDRLPELATDGAGHWVAVWEARNIAVGSPDVDRDIYVARSADNGVSWSAPAALNTNAATDSGNDIIPVIRTDGLGNWVVVWETNETMGDTLGQDADIFFARSTDNGLIWSDPAPLNTDAAIDERGDFQPDIVADGLGHWVAVWSSRNTFDSTVGVDPDIVCARSVDGGATWTDPAVVNHYAATDADDDAEPEITTDRNGLWVVAWTSIGSLGATGVDGDIFLATSSDNGAMWSEARPLNTNAEMDSGTDRFCDVQTDGAGQWVAVWESDDTFGDTLGTDRDIMISFSTDDTATWTDPAAIAAYAASDVSFANDDNARVTTDGNGHWMVVWASSAMISGFDMDVLVALGTDGSAPTGATAQEILDYLLGITETIEDGDVNEDGKVDIADLIKAVSSND